MSFYKNDLKMQFNKKRPLQKKQPSIILYPYPNYLVGAGIGGVAGLAPFVKSIN